MKKILFSLLAAAAAFCSCNEPIAIDSPVEYGSIAANIAADAAVVTKAEADPRELNDDEKSIYTITVTTADGASTSVSKVTVADYGERRTFAAGNYKMAVESCTESAAESGKGQARYYGTDENIVVTAGQQTEAEVTCKMANSMMSVSFDESFTKIFTDGKVAVTVTDSDRAFEFTSAVTDAYYFNMAANNKATLNYTISGTYKADGQVKNYSYSKEMSPAEWLKLTVKASTENGEIAPVIKVDESVSEVTADATVDPYKPDKTE